MVYKPLHGFAPEYLCSRFAIREAAYNLRDSENKICILYHGQSIPIDSERLNRRQREGAISGAVSFTNLSPGGGGGLDQYLGMGEPLRV